MEFQNQKISTLQLDWSTFQIVCVSMMWTIFLLSEHKSDYFKISADSDTEILFTNYFLGTLKLTQVVEAVWTHE